MAKTANDDGDQVVNMQQIQHAPDAVGRQDVKCTIGEIGHAADAEGQVETDGHQCQDGRIDQGVQGRADKHGFRDLSPVWYKKGVHRSERSAVRKVV